MWTRSGNAWSFRTLPALTVEAFVMPGNSIAWCACFMGQPVKQIAPGRNSADVRRRTFEYFDRRVNL